MGNDLKTRISEKIDGLRLSIELEEVIIRYLKPVVDDFLANKIMTPTGMRRVIQSTNSKNQIKEWKQELEDLTNLLYVYSECDGASMIN